MLAERRILDAREAWACVADGAERAAISPMEFLLHLGLSRMTVADWFEHGYADARELIEKGT